MADCPRCGTGVGLAAQSTPDGMIFKCAQCQLAIAEPELEPDVAPAPQQRAPQRIPERAENASLESVASDPAALIREAKRQLKTRRSRIRQLKRELKAEEKAEKQLARLLDAADGKPLAVVRELKRSSG